MKLKVKNEKLGEVFSRAGLSLLLCVGLTLPMVLVLSLDKYWPAAILMCFVVTLVFSLLNLERRLKWFVLAGFVIWQAAEVLLSPGGGFVISSITQVGKSLFLKLSGQPDALPLLAMEAALLLAALFAVLSYFLCMRGAGFYPVLGILLIVLMSVWFAGRQDLLVYSLPAMITLVVLYSRNIHEDLPARRVVPIAVIAVALSFLLLPVGRVASPALEKVAQDTRQAIYDYLFFTEPRNVFSLASEGYYPEGQQQLGGPVTPSEQLAMTVKTPRNVLLRGVIKDEYTGRIWRDTTGGRRYLYISPRWRSLRDSFFNVNLPAAQLLSGTSLMEAQTVSVTMEAPSASTIFTPQRVRDLAPGSGMVVYFNNASELFITRDLVPGDTYTVKAPLLQGGDPGVGTLVEASRDTPDDAYANISGAYTVLPSHMEQPVFELAANITQNYATPYDKALAIKTYLTRYFRYTLDAAAPPENVDFVTYFLFKGKEGYCTYFASAMTVLCRMAGLPARYVEGFLAEPGADGIARVTGRNAHAWTEVYFSGFGWLAFDATPPQQQNNPPEESPPPPESEPSPSPSPSVNPEQTPTPAPQAPTPTPTPNPTPSPSPEPSIEPPPGEDLPDQPPKPPIFWWLLLILLVLAAMIYLRLRMTTPAARARRAKDERDAMNAYIGGVYDILRLNRDPPGLAESPLAHAAKLDKQNKYPHPLLPMAESLCLSQYSRHPVQDGDVAVARETFAALYAPIGRFKKARFRLYRAFARRKNRK
jgi:transglutaminase-like putative cysteine protease